jgi:hypothetical protein
MVVVVTLVVSLAEKGFLFCEKNSGETNWIHADNEKGFLFLEKNSGETNWIHADNEMRTSGLARQSPY